MSDSYDELIYIGDEDDGERFAELLDTVEEISTSPPPSSAEVNPLAQLFLRMDATILALRSASAILAAQLAVAPAADPGSAAAIERLLGGIVSADDMVGGYEPADHPIYELRLWAFRLSEAYETVGRRVRALATEFGAPPGFLGPF